MNEFLKMVKDGFKPFYRQEFYDISSKFKTQGLIYASFGLLVFLLFFFIEYNKGLKLFIVPLHSWFYFYYLSFFVCGKENKLSELLNFEELEDFLKKKSLDYILFRTTMVSIMGLHTRFLILFSISYVVLAFLKILDSDLVSIVFAFNFGVVYFYTLFLMFYSNYIRYKG